MDTKQNPFSPEDSFRLINQMIANARQDYEHRSFFFLLWGWLLLLTGIGIYCLHYYDYPHAEWLWAIQGVAGGIISVIYSKSLESKRQNSKMVNSPVNTTILNLWLAFGITLFFIIFAGGRNPIPFVLLVTALPTFLSGRILRFSPLVFGGISFWILGCVSVFVPYPDNSLIFSFAILTGYLVPGYLLRKQEKQKFSVQGS